MFSKNVPDYKREEAEKFLEKSKIMKSTMEIYEQKLLGSEKEKIKFMPRITMNVEEPTIIELSLRGVHVGSLMVKTRRLDYNPRQEGFKIDLSIRNINPIE